MLTPSDTLLNYPKLAATEQNCQLVYQARTHGMVHYIKTRGGCDASTTRQLTNSKSISSWWYLGPSNFGVIARLNNSWIGSARRLMMYEATRDLSKHGFHSASKFPPKSQPFLHCFIAMFYNILQLAVPQDPSTMIGECRSSCIMSWPRHVWASPPQILRMENRSASGWSWHQEFAKPPADTNKTTAVWPRLQAVLILTASSGCVFVFQLPTSHGFWRLVWIDHGKSHTKHLQFTLQFIPVSVQQFGTLCHTVLMRLCLPKRCRDNTHQWANPFYPTVLWAVMFDPPFSLRGGTASMKFIENRWIQSLTKPVTKPLILALRWWPSPLYYLFFTPILATMEQNFQLVYQLRAHGTIHSIKTRGGEDDSLDQILSQHQTEVESWEHRHNTLPLEMLSVENKNRSWMAKSALWLPASSFSEPARASRTLRVPTALVSTSILVSLTESAEKSQRGSEHPREASTFMSSRHISFAPQLLMWIKVFKGNHSKRICLFPQCEILTLIGTVLIWEICWR